MMRKDACPFCIQEGAAKPSIKYCKRHKWKYQHWFEPWRRAFKSS
ncbi:hypothetical protein Ferp_1197 [Ferroglobus placidus DSM 10642]|uniref:Uncharacterized protein n=1 Tax=Ferroglobus placidus (strain DSM 10642 / AEDII12DO) TaxID=589924 RepID=D3RXZ2_FERPA|nr:hypothetical protein [Ferroglobus placidus]ADC65355.1 hypothetical protein Ferp_1197 [Ferroglobus placidus DSM 10642]